MRQLSVEVRALSSVHTFEDLGVRLEITFTTSLLPDDLDVLS